MNRYGVDIGLEKRMNDFGLKTFTVEIDSIAKDYCLFIGAKPYYLNGPLSTTLNIWGLTLRGTRSDFFVGKTKDQASLLSPSFTENRYTIGCRLQKNISYHIPIEFYLLRRSDAQNYSGILNNNSLGTNMKMKLGENFSLNSQLSTSISDSGFGSALALDAGYMTQKYGGQAYLSNIINDYATPSNLLAQKGSWFRTYLYQKPLEWINFSQDISYASIYDLGIGFNTAIKKSPLPDLAHGINFSSGGISQSVNCGYQYRDFSIAGSYGWAKDHNDFGIRIGQAINSYQFWTGFQINNSLLVQFGGVFPFSSNIRLKNFLNIANQNGHTTRSIGLETSIQLLQNFHLNATYELANYNGAGQNDHFLSVGLSNNLQFDEIGFGFVSGKVFMDFNNNGFFDIEDQPVTDIEVILDNTKRVTTNKNGDYSFAFVKKGGHNVSLNLGCMPAEIGTEKRKYTLNTEFLSRARTNFALGPLGVIEGIMFFDENTNGTKDQGEPGVPNVVIKINGSLTTTDKNGKYRIANLASGTYTLEAKILPPETVLATPEYAYIHLKAGEKFTNRPLGVIKKERPVNKKIFGE